tara:strand:- start:30547 stop:31674 length:1128 start_codon:yes stop_codon:yes gene_type:complete
MKNILNRLNSKTVFALLPLFLIAMVTSFAQAAPTPDFAAEATGSTSSLTVTVSVSVADADLDLPGNYYAGFNFENAWYFLTPQGWVDYSTGTVPVFASTNLYTGSAVLVADTDFSDYVGAELYIGYGLTESDMLDNAKYSMVYTITADSVAQGPAVVLLGSSANFAILAKAAVSTVPASAVYGDVGVSPAATSFLTGFSLTLVGTTSATSTQVTGTLYGADMSPPTSTSLTTAVLDMQTAYSDAAGRPTPDFLNLGTGNIGGRTLEAGLYNWGSSVTIPSDLVIFGSANDVWIFQIAGDLSISANRQVTLAGGAQAKNIFWQVAGEVVVEAGAGFKGNILSQTAITMQTGSSLSGRALAQTAVAIDSATVVKPAP